MKILNTNRIIVTIAVLICCLEGFALSCGINGTGLAASMAALGGLGGYMIKARIKE